MKRILPLLLIVAFVAAQLPGLLAVPAQAADLTETSFVELLDYGGIDRVVHADGTEISSSDDTYFYVNNEATVYFELPSMMAVHYVDIIINIGDSTKWITEVSIFGVPLQSVRQGEFYRFYGNLSLEQPYSAQLAELPIKITCNRPDWTLYCDFFSVKVSSQHALSYSVGGIGSAQANGNLEEFTFPSSDSVTINTGTDPNVLASFEFTDWKMYDYLDLLVYIISDEIDSIAVWSNQYLPFEYSFLDSGSSSDVGHYLIQVRIDIRGIDRTLSDNPCIYFQLISNTNEIVSFSVLRASASVLTNGTNILAYWFQRVISSNTSNSSNIIDSIGSAADKIAAAFSSGFGGTGVGETVKQEANDKADQLGSSVNAMGAMSKPDASSAGSSGNISSVIGSADIISGTQVLTTIMEVPTFTKIITLALIFTMAAYVLFGKRG